MKYISLFAILFALNAQAATAPFLPEVQNRFEAVEAEVDALQGDSAEGAAISKKYAKAVYDVAIDGGSSTATKNLGVTLPAGAIITAIYVYINTRFTDSGTGSVALQCAGTQDLMAYQDMTAVPIDSWFGRVAQATAFGTGGALIADAAALSGAYISGASVPTACAVTAVVRGDSGYVAQTAGKFTAIIEYFNRN